MMKCQKLKHWSLQIEWRRLNKKADFICKILMCQKVNEFSAVRWTNFIYNLMLLELKTGPSDLCLIAGKFFLNFIIKLNNWLK